jgi:hypothetical protein
MWIALTIIFFLSTVFFVVRSRRIKKKYTGTVSTCTRLIADQERELRSAWDEEAKQKAFIRNLKEEHAAETQKLREEIAAHEQGRNDQEENYEQQFLSHQELIDRQAMAIASLHEDRWVLYNAAKRCHKNCLPNLHGQPEEERLVFERMDG